MAIPLRWEGEALPHHIKAVETANGQYDFISQALRRINSPPAAFPAPREAILSPLATGGAMAVYKLTAMWGQGPPQHAVCKIPLERRIVYTEHTTALETTHQLLDRLVRLADHLQQDAPGLFPRSGGVWHWQDTHTTPRHILVEEFIPGTSIERLKAACEQQWMTGHLDTKSYNQRRAAFERLAVATFTRLWNALDRRVFTSDPSPWNILVPPQDTEDVLPQTATIIDLHSLEEDVGLSYVIQRLAAVYGLRQEVLEQALLPGILDTLGPEEGRALLHAEVPRLEAEARYAAQNLGVDLQQPLLHAIRALS